MDLIKELQKQADIIRGKSVHYRDVEIKSLTVSQYFGILPLINSIMIEGDITEENISELVPPQILKYKEVLDDIFEIAFGKKVDEFKDLIPLDLYNIIGIINMQMDHSNFTSAITSLRSLSRNSKADLIANQKRINDQPKGQNSSTQ